MRKVFSNKQELKNCDVFILLFFTLSISVALFQKPERQTSIEEKRKYVVAEILETEKSYVDALKMIQEVIPSTAHGHVRET